MHVGRHVRSDLAAPATGEHDTGRLSRSLTALAFALAASAVVACAPAAGPDGPTEASSQFADFVERFAETGGYRGGGDLSAAAFESSAQELDAFLEEIGSIDRSGLTVDEDIDWRFAHSILMGRKIRLERMQSWRRDPRVYMPFRSLGMTVERPGDPAEKATGLIEMLESAVSNLDDGRANLENFVPEFHELSLFMAESARPIFAEQIPAFAATAPEQQEDVIAANDAAAEALEAFIAFLADELPSKTEGTFAIGREVYDLMIENEYLLPYDSDSLYEYGREQFDATVAELEEVARAIDPSRTWQELVVEIKSDYPEPSRMIEAHQEWVDASRQHILDNDLIPIPWPESATVVPRAEYLRKTSYYGNFSSAREQNEDGVWAARWQINPFEDQWPDEQKQEYLVEHDWGVIIVTAPHETYAGHHVHSLYQRHNPRPLRRRFGTSMFSEGWGLYNEHFMEETGFLPDERIHLRQLQLRLWRNARVVWDVGIHTGKMTYDEAVSLLADGVGFLPWAAKLEIDASAESPGYRLGYFMGMSEILKMRDEYRERVGDAFTLSGFHERLLQMGSMPPALMRDALFASLDAEAD